MYREKATDAKDLPHEFESDTTNPGHGVCTVCQGRLLDTRHLAWEQAAEFGDAPDLPRERGA